MNPFHLNSRYFNILTYDAKHHRITKRSEDEAKLRNEIRWYLLLPQPLRRYVPDIIDYGLEDGNVYVTMECVSWPTLHDLYMKKPHSGKWRHSVFERLQQAFSDFADYRADVPERDLQTMYGGKTLDRLHQLLRQRDWARRIYRRGSVLVNGRRFPCPVRMLEGASGELDALWSRPLCRIIHGDFCFSNLFIDDTGTQIKMIDPRGSFGTPGLYGDARYDMAKVRHSLSGYEHIISDRFHAEWRDGQLDIDIPLRAAHREWLAIWDARCLYRQRAIRLIEALLFLSMVPLHADQQRRQWAMYGLGVRLLHHALST